MVKLPLARQSDFDHSHLARTDLDDFVACYASGERRKRKEAERASAVSRLPTCSRDKVNLDTSWLKDDTLDDPDLLPRPTRSRPGLSRTSSLRWSPSGAWRRSCSRRSHRHK